MEYLTIFEWIEATSMSIALRESILLWPMIITVHLLSVYVSAGTIIVLDLRLLGWGMKQTPG